VSSKPPRYFGNRRLDADPFLRDFAVWAYTAIGLHCARDFERLAEDIARHDELRDQELKDLRRAFQELDD
jgi:hypothetical protein